MPFPRGRKPTAAAGSKIPKLNATASENQEEATQAKRSSSPPRGAPKKRTAFIDITNAHKVQISFPGKKKEPGKKTAKKTSSTSVSASNRANLKKSSSVSSEGTISERERTDTEEEEKEGDTSADVAAPVEEQAAATSPAAREVPAHLRRQEIPKEFDIDSENSEDCYMCPEYAKDIFDYLKNREEKFVLCNYMPTQPSLNSEMRAILIDWLVEVQENFELYHETLYLAVKMTDHYLAKTPVHREMLQLVGSTAMLIASKFECVSASMDTLTLARYYCEMSLMEMDLVPERGSLVASACLLMALVTKDLGGWSPILQFHSGYQASDLAPVVRKIYSMLSAPPDDKLRAIKNKYSHKVFFEVASLPLVSIDILEKALSS
ncbi:G2/mitotic-specific cyclin-B3 isoform X2 [Neolamprologus brichardi]|uniref:G2/mitotic-specific cyclin-B3 isoform X2 n=1 Tax=Neolamprologus brichardi TaxID=32507 RepID=UPI001643A50E|nr:G2/mitotic-specific cyclin-B3 isoform X2 [Neolamprologus brichardi]